MWRGGIMLAVVKENITVISEVAQEKEIGQSLCILLCLLLDSNRSKIRIIYAPQQNVISNNDLKTMYNNISKQTDFN